jgi:hypothetical protein
MLNWYIMAGIDLRDILLFGKALGWHITQHLLIEADNMV